MKVLELMRKLEECGDVKVSIVQREGEQVEYQVTLQDFTGFDGEWNEVYREYSEPELVEQFSDMLEEECEEMECDYYEYYFFEDFSIFLDYASCDI